MHKHCSTVKLALFATLAATLLLTACAAGDPRYAVDTPAGFWPGLWHGMIAPIAFLISLLRDNIEVYERLNTGGWYDAGFLFGVLLVWGGGSHAHRWPRKKTAEQRANEQEWEEIGKKVEAKMRRKIREWAEAEPDEEWEVVGDKAEAKLKAKLRAWAEDDPTVEHPALNEPAGER